LLILLFIAVFPIFAQSYRPLLPGGNPVAVNKYRTYVLLIPHTQTPFGLSCVEARSAQNGRSGSGKSHADIIGRRDSQN
jgi:hypothetical protein